MIEPTIDMKLDMIKALRILNENGAEYDVIEGSNIIIKKASPSCLKRLLYSNLSVEVFDGQTEIHVW